MPAYSDPRNFFYDGTPAPAFMFPESVSTGRNRHPTRGDDTFVLQYYPDSVSDTYSPEYAQKQIPGGTHPLQQWVGGSGRDISFTAQFTAEIDLFTKTARVDVQANKGLNVLGLHPSSRYTVDIRAAMARFMTYMLPSYGGRTGGGLNNLASPPPKLWLALTGLKLGGNSDSILTVLKSAPITYEAFFPNGTPRIVQVSLTFSEIVQRTVKGGTSIKFIGREMFEQAASNYKYRGSADKVLGG